jgi:hypothetical protein
VTLRDFGPRLSAFNSMFSPRHRQGSGGETLTVPAISLDEFCNRDDLRPDVVKIDAESAESHILAGMRRLLTEHRVALTLEVGDAGVKGAPASTKLLSSVLDHGYVPIEFRDGVLRLHQLQELYGYGNILLIPRERPL